jgi:hypothetical protein
MPTADQRLIADLEAEVAESADRFSDQQQTTGVPRPPLIEVTETQTESAPFGGEFGSVDAESTESGGDCPDCPECPTCCRHWYSNPVVYEPTGCNE